MADEENNEVQIEKESVKSPVEITENTTEQANEPEPSEPKPEGDETVDQEQVGKSEQEVPVQQVQQIEEESLGEDYTPLSSHEDTEQKAAYAQYRRLEKNIKNHNKILEKLKAEIQRLERKPCLTKCDKSDLKEMRENWEREMLKLKGLIQQAINLQNSGSKRHYREFPLITTFDEDNLNLINRTCDALQEHAQTTRKRTGNHRASGGESSEGQTNCSANGSDMSVAEERKLIQEIFAALKECDQLKECKKKKPSSKPCQETDSLEKMKEKMKSMQQKIIKLTECVNNKQENETCNQKTCSHKTLKPCNVPPITCGNNNHSNNVNVPCQGSNHFQQLKENYLYLLTEFNKKDEELKELTKKLRSSCSKCNSGNQGDTTSADESELQLLRIRISEMKEEQIEFKCLMREQSSQLDEYRNKYLAAQQKVEEQCVLIEKLNMNNKCIEQQINQEVKDIRAKFQERLTDLLQFPKLLENEQLKVAQLTKEKEDVDNKLLIVCKELKALKSKQQNNTTDDNSKALLNRCQQELSQVKKNLEEVQRQRDMFCEQLRSTTDDLNTLRSESAKIIARTKERAEILKQQQKEQIDRLERQLAQCRATACISVSDRESVIKEMQGQLNSLSYSFDAAQKQIKTLRNHIAYMSNENSYPLKC